VATTGDGLFDGLDIISKFLKAARARPAQAPDARAKSALGGMVASR